MKALPEIVNIDQDTVNPIEIFIRDFQPNNIQSELWRKQFLAALDHRDQIVLSALKETENQYGREKREFSRSTLEFMRVEIQKKLIE